MRAADEDFLGPGDRPVGVEGQVLEAQQVTQVVVPVRRQEQAGTAGAEQGRIAAVEPGPREGEDCARSEARSATAAASVAPACLSWQCVSLTGP